MNSQFFYFQNGDLTLSDEKGFTSFESYSYNFIFSQDKEEQVETGFEKSLLYTEDELKSTISQSSPLIDDKNNKINFPNSTEAIEEHVYEETLHKFIHESQGDLNILIDSILFENLELNPLTPTSNLTSAPKAKKVTQRMRKVSLTSICTSNHLYSQTNKSRSSHKLSMSPTGNQHHKYTNHWNQALVSTKGRSKNGCRAKEPSSDNATAS